MPDIEEAMSFATILQIVGAALGLIAIAVISFFLGGFVFADEQCRLEAQLGEVRKIAEKYGYTAIKKLLEE